MSTQDDSNDSWFHSDDLEDTAEGGILSPSKMSESIHTNSPRSIASETDTDLSGFIVPGSPTASEVKALDEYFNEQEVGLFVISFFIKSSFVFCYQSNTLTTLCMLAVPLWHVQ
jgi:hypothetical protein